MLPRLTFILFVLAALASACVADWPPPGGDYCPDGCTTTEPVVPDPTVASDPAPTSTDEPTGTGLETTADDPSTTSPDVTGSTTAAEPDEPPSIVSFDVEPDLIEDNGLIDIEVSTLNSDGVRMQLETGEVIELTPGQAPRPAGWRATPSATGTCCRRVATTP